MSELKLRINESIKAAMRAGEKDRLGTLRLISAALKQREIDERIELSDAEVLATLSKMIKQRRESIGHFEQAGRTELAAQEYAEIAIISEFLPEPLAEAELDRLINQAITETGATGIRDMGKVMNLLRPQLQGRADPAAVSARVKERLNA
ncbi:MAG TPA: GatB/YqeY domain-containing protein [Gammaproteobacteria bacterium]|nr:GatB/YqeY domain-containing protein [Gammaproteobacteria bacterium]